MIVVDGELLTGEETQGHEVSRLLRDAKHRVVAAAVIDLETGPHAVSAYDAAYLTLAESLDAPLLTCDLRLARATGQSARIVYAG